MAGPGIEAAKNIRQVTATTSAPARATFLARLASIFQAEEKGTGNPFYQIFVMDLDTGKLRRVSPGVGKTTCGYFRPDGKKIIFASSHLDPDAKKHYSEEYKQREEDADRQAAAATSGTSTRTWTSSRPTPTAPA